jgi:hypothetical protein
MRSASAPLSRTLSRMPAVSRGRLGVALQVLGDAPNAGAHVRLEHAWLGQLKAREAVEHDRVVVRAQAKHFDDPRQRPDFVEILKSRFVDLGIALAHDAYDGTFQPDEVFDEAHTARAADVDGDDACRENDAVA